MQVPDDDLNPGMTSKSRKKPIRRVEDGEQIALVSWFALQYPGFVLFAIPNGLVRNRNQAIFMHRMGLVSGMPDLFLCRPVGEYAGLFIELKRPAFITHEGKMDKGKLTVAQADMLLHLTQVGYQALVCYGFEEAKRAIIDYMGD